MRNVLVPPAPALSCRLKGTGSIVPSASAPSSPSLGNIIGIIILTYNFWRIYYLMMHHKGHNEGHSMMRGFRSPPPRMKLPPHGLSQWQDRTGEGRWMMPHRGFFCRLIIFLLFLRISCFFLFSWFIPHIPSITEGATARKLLRY